MKKKPSLLLVTLRSSRGNDPLPAADLLARIIMSQERMRNPFGLILMRLGQKPAQTHLFDPNRTKLEIRLARPMLPIIRFVDRWMG